MCSKDKKVNIGIISGHDLLRKGFIMLVSNLGYNIQLESASGKEFILNLDSNNVPSLILVDIDRLTTDAYETITHLKTNYPFIKLLALTIEVDENSFDKIKRSGANGFILKTIEPWKLKLAINSVGTTGFYFQENTTHSYNTFSSSKLEDSIKKYFK